MTTRNHIIFLFLLVVLVVDAFAGEVARTPLPAGMGRYIVVLKDPYHPSASDPHPGESPSEPDFGALGGIVRSQSDQKRLVDLPLGASKVLREDRSVAYVQRVWMGESFDTWDEQDDARIGTNARFDVQTDTDFNVNWTTGTYLYDGSGNIKQIGNDTYTYDTAGRLIKSVVGATTETYKYDSFGNLIEKSVTGAPTGTIPVDPTNNRLVGEIYDPAGNLTTHAGVSYTYDSVGMLQSVSRTGWSPRYYIYTADDERIGTAVSGTYRWRIRDPDEHVLREFESHDLSYMTWNRDFFYGDGRLMSGAREAYYGGNRHYHLDHLGSIRLITNDQRIRVGEHDFMPFGVEKTVAVQEDLNFGYLVPDPAKFTGHERDFIGYLNVDNTDYLDYMHARYYDPNMGRFLSVDPVLDVETALRRPQSWNRYSYAFNNPLAYVDPDGRLVNLATMEEKDRTLLISQLRDKTGLDLAYKDGLLVSNGVLKNANGNTLGSATARADLSKAISAKETYYGIGRNDSPSINMGQRVGPHLNLDFADIAKINYGKNDPATFDAGSIFMHELSHAFGLKDPTAGMLRAMPTLRGAVVDRDNKIRRELGLPLRSQYRAIKDAQGLYYLPFSNGPIYIPGDGDH